MRDTYHHGDLKKQLILVGIDIINQEGPEGLSLRKAAERCRCQPRGTLQSF